MRYLIVDVETTEINPSWARVLSGALLMLDKDFRVVGSDYRYMWNRRSQISEGAKAVHQLTEDFLYANAESPEVVMDDWYKYFQRANLIAHNVKFDAAVMENEMLNAGYNLLYNNKFCTMTAWRNHVKALGANGNVKNPKLIEACEFFNVSTDFIMMVQEQYFPNINIPANIQFHSSAFDVCAMYACMMKGGLQPLKTYYDIR